MNKGKIILGVLAGAAAGAVLGILLAPDKGLETRKKILQKGNRTLTGIKENFEEVLQNVLGKMET